ncbi:hypothetical protein [Glycomyces arizonensis]|uniref:hypothetical protein n=1 Tax=Glycomyces arizonensis TaxID=256035 RepID=UPI000418912D|nr:hypothetical protein [Glycomyces arizonensis]
MSTFSSEVATCLQITPEKIDEYLYQFYRPMVEIRTRELVLERFPEIGQQVWYATREEWILHTESFNYDDTSPYTPTEKWSETTNCAVPYEAEESDLDSICGEAQQDASQRFNDASTKLSSLLYPDSLLDVAIAVDRLVDFNEVFGDFIEKHEGTSFNRIADLFEGWTGGSDNNEAFLAFGNMRANAGHQRTLLYLITQITVAEFTIQAETRNSLGARLSNLAEKLIEVQKARSFVLENIYLGTAMFTPLGYIDGAVSIVENFGIENAEGEQDTSWFTSFKDKYLIGEYEVGMDSDTFEALAAGIDDVLATVESTLADGRSTISEFIAQVDADTSGLIQGAVY